MTARPSTGTLTGAGYSLVSGSTTKYSKTSGTATLIVDLAAGTVNTGSVEIQPTTVGVEIAESDVTAALAALASIAATSSPAASMHTAGLTYYGTTA